MASGTNPSGETPVASRGEFFSPDRVAKRTADRREVVEQVAPVANEVVKAVVTTALSAVPHPAAQISAPAVGAIAGESTESASRIAGEALVIPGMEAAERGSGRLKGKIDKQC